MKPDAIRDPVTWVGPFKLDGPFEPEEVQPKWLVRATYGVLLFATIYFSAWAILSI